MLFVFDAEGQITPKSVVGSGRNTNSFKFLCMCSLPARTRTVRGSDYSPAVGLSEQRDKLVAENWRD